MKKLYHIIACLIILSLAGCGWFIPKMQPSILQTIEAKENTVAASVATTVERRVFYVNLHGDMKGKFCAEPPPDAAENIASTLAATANASGVGHPEITASLVNSLSTAVKEMTKRSQGIILYRDGMFNLCQAYLNGMISSEAYINKSSELLGKAYTLIDKELEKSEGRVGPTNPIKTPQTVSVGITTEDTQSISTVANSAAAVAAQQAVSKVKEGSDPQSAIESGKKAAEQIVESAANKLNLTGKTADAADTAVKKASEKTTEIVGKEVKKNEESKKKEGGQ